MGETVEDLNDRLQIPAGHHAPCHICGEPCNSLAGNPGLWPIALAYSREPGIVKWHHTGCVSDRLTKLLDLEEGRSVILPSDRKHAEAMLIVADAFLGAPHQADTQMEKETGNA